MDEAAAVTVASFSYYYSSAIHLLYGQNGPDCPSTSALVPIESPSSSPPTSVPVILPDSVRSAAASKIQAAYRARRIRALLRRIAGVGSEASRLERLIQSQETVDAVRSDGRERVVLNERLMALLLVLDSVPGVDEEVRARRRAASRRVVGIMEVLDAVAEERVDGWSDGFPVSWEEIVAEFGGDSGGGGGGESQRRQCYRRCWEKLGMIFGDENVNMGY